MVVAPVVRFGADGLVPAIVQDEADGRVLMLAWMDEEALAATAESGLVHFHSRSRNRLWQKGESSGNSLRVRSIATDCDNDAVLIRAEPAGPTCHRGTRSCFDVDGAEERANAFAWLATLSDTIEARASDRPADSYTARLLAGGVDSVARKLTEEATEVLIAAKDDAAAEAAGTERDATHQALAGEAADLLYHALVLLAERDVTPDEVVAVLRDRHREKTRP